jgi:hypothetical protein
MRERWRPKTYNQLGASREAILPPKFIERECAGLAALAARPLFGFLMRPRRLKPPGHQALLHPLMTVLFSCLSAAAG